MKLISYNVNGIRAALNKGLDKWLAENDYDIVGFQEIKANSEDIPVEKFEDLGYHCYWFSAQKKGYSGVGIISKIKPIKVETGMGDEFFDSEGRVIIAYYNNFVVINAYFPSGTSGDERQTLKYEFLDKFYDFVMKFKVEHPNLFVIGDYNIAHTEIDIHNPVSNKNSSGFLPEERAWMTKWFQGGMVDIYRYFYPEKKDVYSWWTYRMNARANNKGWRIDYISVSEPLVLKLEDAYIYMDVVQSDHCPIGVKFKM